MLSLQEQTVLVAQEYNRDRPEYSARRRAIRQWWRVHSAALWRRLWARVAGGAAGLRSLDDDLRAAEVGARHFTGLQTVPVDEIRGSEGRSRDFDAEFRPLNTHNEARWIDVAAAWLADDRLPPIDLIRLGDAYYVRDGHHRVSVARALGQSEIDALVTVWE